MTQYSWLLFAWWCKAISRVAHHWKIAEMATKWIQGNMILRTVWWQPCLASIWYPSDDCQWMAIIWLYKARIRLLLGFSTWCPHGVHIVSTWCPRAAHIVSIWYPHCVYIVSTWYPHAAHMVHMWCPRGNNLMLWVDCKLYATLQPYVFMQIHYKYSILKFVNWIKSIWN